MSRTSGALYREAAAKLSAARIDNAALDARVLLSHVLGLNAVRLISAPDEPVSGAQSERFADFIRRRLAGEPVARIVGAKEFWSRSFSLSPETLVPRPETETLIETAIKELPDRAAPLRILDLGTGSGILLGALLLEYSSATGVGIDVQEGAVRKARENLAALGVAHRAQFVRGDWADALDARFDLVVSNPPYIAATDIAELPVEVRAHDPAAALDGGADGLKAYRAIVGNLSQLLAPGGIAILELGAGQEPAVAEIARHAQISVNGPARKDLAGWPRALVLGPAN